LQANELEQWQSAHTVWELDCKVLQMQDEANEKKAKGHAAKGDAKAARAMLEPTETPAEPTARRYIVNDATVEKLGELLQQNPWGTLSYRDELYGLLTKLDSAGQEGSRSFYLTSYDGNQGYTFDRIMRGTVHIPRVCLAMIGGIQPGRIQEYVRGAVAGGSADDGFRASARTMLVDELNLDPLAIEANLAHAVKDSNGRSYNRTQYLKQRLNMVQQWADYLDKLARGADVIAFKSA